MGKSFHVTGKYRNKKVIFFTFKENVILSLYRVAKILQIQTLLGRLISIYYVTSPQQFCPVKNNHTIVYMLGYCTRLRMANSSPHYKVSLRVTLTFPSVSVTKPVCILAPLAQLEQKLNHCETTLSKVFVHNAYHSKTSQCFVTLQQGKYLSFNNAYVMIQIKGSSQGHAALRAVLQCTLYHKGIHAVDGCFYRALQRCTHYSTSGI